jgi:hypothetical protein
MDSRVRGALKGALLPDGPAPRTVLAGLARGVRMRIDFSSQTRLYLGLYEIEIDRHLRRVLRPGVTAYDVGSQHGYDALAIAKRTGAAVAAFECDAQCLERMRESFCLNPRLARLIQPVAATVGSGPTDLHLDDWAYNGGFVPDFIQIDIEGAEIRALHSAKRILRERHPSLIVEVHSADLERQAGEILAQHGYRPVVVSQRRFLPDHRPTAHNRWLVAS